MAKIENYRYSVEEAFRECFYIVPDYQREYVWTEKVCWFSVKWTFRTAVQETAGGLGVPPRPPPGLCPWTPRFSEAWDGHRNTLCRAKAEKAGRHGGLPHGRRCSAWPCPVIPWPVASQQSLPPFRRTAPYCSAVFLLCHATAFWRFSARCRRAASRRRSRSAWISAARPASMSAGAM